MAEHINKTDTLNEGRVKLNEAINDSNIAKDKSESADVKATQALSESASTQTQLDTIVIDGDSSVEAAQARVDEKGESHTTLKARIDDGMNSVNQQLAENTNTNAVFKTTESESVTVDQTELVDDDNVTMGTNWTGNTDIGFTHIPGSTDDLIINIPSLKTNTIYQVDIFVSNPDVSGGGTPDFYVTLGNSPLFETYQGSTSRYIFGIKTISGKQLVITPWELYEGYVTVSVKEVIGRVEPYQIFKDSNNNTTLETRVSKKDVKSIYIGLNSGQYANDFATENVAVGTVALSNNTSGFWNTSLGGNTLVQNTVGTRNVAVGRNALRDNIAGDRNIALGTFALLRNKTGRNNIAIGADSLWNNEGGSNNIGIGLLALDRNIDSDNNIGIGDHAMSLANGGTHNIGMGRYALDKTKNSNSIGIGYTSLAQNTEGEENIAIGTSSLRNSISGNNNIAIGISAMEDAQPDHNNIAIGRNSLRNTEGNRNVAVGGVALFSSVAGERNTSIGYSSMKDHTQGNGNVAIGISAYGEGTTGTNNVAIGNSALMKNEANNNTSVGSNSSEQNKSGTNNTAFGTRALRNNVISDNNTGVGYSALSNVENGKNTALGSLAGGNVTTGEGNVFVGYRAGVVTTTGNNNIAIGNDVGFTEGIVSNQLNIGDVIKSGDMTTGIVELKKLQLTNLPASEPSESGMVWNDSGVLKIS